MSVVPALRRQDISTWSGVDGNLAHFVASALPKAGHLMPGMVSVEAGTKGIAHAEERQQRPSWWGPLDGPCPVSEAAGGGGGGGGSHDSNKEAAFLQHQLAQVRAAVAAREGELAQIFASDQAMSAEVCSLCDEVRSAIAKQHAALSQRSGQQEELHRLSNTLGQANARICELESKVVPSSDLYLQSVRADSVANDADDDSPADASGREQLAALEGELRRKSMRVLELRRRVHALETQLGEQLQSNADLVSVVEAGLQDAIARFERAGG